MDSKAEMRVKRNETKYSACALCASRCEWSECPGHRKRGARWTGAAGSWFGAFFCPNGALEKARAGSSERMECIEANERKGCMCAVVKRCGVKRNTAATTWICRVGKDIYPESEMSGMKRNERMNASSCVRLAIAV